MFKHDPINVRTIRNASDAWMYRKKRSFDVYVNLDAETVHNRPVVVRITRRQIDAWIAEADKP